MNTPQKEIDKICKAIRKQCRKEIPNSCKRKWKEMGKDSKDNMRWFVRNTIGNIGIDNLEIELHNSFLRKWISNNWLYGKTKSYKKMTHPNLLPWWLLSLDVQRTYGIMVEVVKEHKS